MSVNTFTCERCGYDFITKQRLITHYKRKNACEPNVNDLSIESCLESLTKKLAKCHECDKCKKKFSHLSSKSRHIKDCTGPTTTNTDSSKNELEDLQKKYTDLKEMVEKMMVSTPTTNVNIGTFINNNGNQNIINLKNFGSENMDYLTMDFLNSCLISNDIVPLIENLHFDKEHPENHNVKLKSSKKELMEVYSNGNWMIADTDETLNELITKGYRVLSSHSKRNKTDILTTEMDKDEYDDVMMWLEKIYDDKRIRKPIKKQLLLLFMNNKAMLLEQP